MTIRLVRLMFCPNECWVGACWERTYRRDLPSGAVVWSESVETLLGAADAPSLARADLVRRVDLFVCVLPCLPIHIQWEG